MEQCYGPSKMVYTMVQSNAARAANANYEWLTCNGGNGGNGTDNGKAADKMMIYTTTLLRSRREGYPP